MSEPYYEDFCSCNVSEGLYDGLRACYMCERCGFPIREEYTPEILPEEAQFYEPFELDDDLTELLEREENRRAREAEW